MKIYDMLREAEETAPPGSSFSYNNDQQKRSLGLLELLLVNH